MQPDIQVHRARRERLIEALGEGVLVLATAPEAVRNRDAHFPYRYDSYFYYLTGFAEPEAVLVLVAGPEPRQILFCREKHEEREIWDGYRFGPEAAREAFRFDETHPIGELDALLPHILEDQPALHYAIGQDAAWDARVLGWLNTVRAKARSGVSAPQRLLEARGPLDAMRLIKDGHELELMRRAAEISASAHVRAMRATRPGRSEHEIEAELLYEFRRLGAEAPAYTSIVAGGANACVLHYIANNQALRDGDLLLIDAGAEFRGYAGDITRTFPVNGRFSGPQREAYEIVLAAQAAAIARVAPGQPWQAPHEAAVKVLVQGMVDLGLLQGGVDGLIEQEAYKRFYMHRTGHWLGLDVHDAGEYKVGGQWRPLEPGMALTVEPGLYIRPAEDVPEALWNIGIRIEDDALVTGSGCEILTHGVPKTVAEIEALVGHD